MKLDKREINMLAKKAAPQIIRQLLNTEKEVRDLKIRIMKLESKIKEEKKL